MPRTAPKKADGSFDHDTAFTGGDLIDYVNRELFPYLQGFKQRATGPDTIEYKFGEIFGETEPWASWAIVQTIDDDARAHDKGFGIGKHGFLLNLAKFHSHDNR